MLSDSRKSIAFWKDDHASPIVLLVKVTRR